MARVARVTVHALPDYFPRVPHMPVALTRMRAPGSLPRPGVAPVALTRARRSCWRRASWLERAPPEDRDGHVAPFAWIVPGEGRRRGRDCRALSRPSRPDLRKVCLRRDVRTLALAIAEGYRLRRGHGVPPPCLQAVPAFARWTAAAGYCVRFALPRGGSTEPGTLPAGLEPTCLRIAPPQVSWLRGRCLGARSDLMRA